VKARRYDGTEIYAQSIRPATMEKKYRRLEPIAEMEFMFQACLIEDLEVVQGKYKSLWRSQKGVKFPSCSTLVTLAVQKG
jgi:hypothetical protein